MRNCGKNCLPLPPSPSFKGHLHWSCGFPTDSSLLLIVISNYSDITDTTIGYNHSSFVTQATFGIKSNFVAFKLLKITDFIQWLFLAHYLLAV